MSKGRKAILGMFGGAGVFALLLAALVWGQAPAGAAGMTGTPTTAAVDEQAALDAIFARFAARLGTDEATIDAAFLAAVNETADEAVRNGQVSAEEADEIKEMVAREGLKGLVAGRQEDGAQENEVKKDRSLGAVWQAAANALGLDAASMKEQLVGGKSLAEIAQERNIATPTLREAMLAASRAELDQAVRDGVISQATADTRYDEITRMVDGLIAEGIGPR